MDGERLRRLLEHDPRGWKEFVERFTATIQKTVTLVLARRGAHDPELVLDIVQEVFVKLIKDDFRLLRKFDSSRSAPATYLSVIARSSTLDELKKRRLKSDPLREDVGETLTIPPEPERGDLLETLPDGLLTGGMLRVMILLFREELSVTEAAEVLGVEAQTVRSQKHRAIARIRQFVKNQKTTVEVK